MTMDTHHQPIHQDLGTPTETPPEQDAAALLALLTCLEFVVGAILYHRVTVLGTAGEILLSPPAWSKAPGLGHACCGVSHSPLLPWTAFSYFVRAGILGFSQVLTNKVLKCMADVHPHFMCATAF